MKSYNKMTEDYLKANGLKRVKVKVNNESLTRQFTDKQIKDREKRGLVHY
jgi:hypothetical protein